MTSNSTLYVGRVTHHRLRPRRHSLAYRAYWLFLDFDEIEALTRRLRLFSHNRFNLFAFYTADHADGGQQPLRTTVEQHLATAGIAYDGGPIKLLTMPRLVGYVFNPLSIYFCYRKDDSIAALLYEVTNTFGERHSYLLATSDAHGGVLRQRCAKRLYVSPFLGMDMRYGFSVAEPDETVRVIVRGSDAEGDIIVASLVGTRRPLTDANLLRLALTYPFMTLKVTLGIHWEAFLLWLKGVRPQPKPEAPKKPISVSPPPALGRST
jgi:uncharacterized protein